MWTPKILGHCTSGSHESSMIILGCVSGVNNVTDDFGVDIKRELSFRYAVISSRQLFRLSFISGILTPVAHTVRSLA